MARRSSSDGDSGRVIDLEQFRNQLSGDSLLGQFLRGRFFRKIFGPILGVIIGLKILGFLCFTYVGPNEYGIKVIRIPIVPGLVKKGVQEKVYDSGFHFVIKPFGFEAMYLFPKDLRVFDLTGTREEAAREASVTQAARIQTSDGFFVDVDASILYKIADPYKVFTKLGPGLAFETGGIMPKAEPVLKQTFGELATEEFYNSPLRVTKANLAKDMLNKDLTEYGLHVEHVLVRYFRYTKEIQKNIEEKKLKDQLVFKNQAEGRAATEAAKVAKVVQEGQATVDIKLQEGRAYVTSKEAERDLYVRKKRAEADLLVQIAEAKKTQLRNDALQGAGSDRMVGLKMAEVYKGLDVVILPSDGANGVNPLNLEQTLKLLEVKK
jgi:regulator of protease activity HflC (stomatin/prohibitin superfamily)